MKFQILSHAGLSVTGAGVNLLCDPWVIGSCYWRSWWNYPPPSKELIESLRPDFIYLTHVHWDHFQGPSLRKFPKTTRIFCPKGNYSRIKSDLNKMSFRDVTELRHGQTVEPAPGFRFTSYQFNPFLDSAIVIEAEGITLLNANDAKFMGWPLKQILNRHPKIDFVFRSHSSANSRLSYEVVDDPVTPVDDVHHYVEEFAYFVQSTGARYAVPFASNMCHLHDDVYRFNDDVQTPHMVADYFRRKGIEHPKLKVMVTGDSWSSDEGFKYVEKDYFTDRAKCLEEYRRDKQGALDKFAEREAKATVTLDEMKKYYDEFYRIVPWVLRRQFKGHPVTYVLTAGDRRMVFRLDLYNKTVEELPEPVKTDHPIEIHASAYIVRQCLKLNLFSHLSISKRVLFRCSKATKKYIVMLNFLYNLYEYDWLPLHRAFKPRAIETWLLRWREIILYFQIIKDLALTRRLNTDKYMQLTPPHHATLAATGG